MPAAAGFYAVIESEDNRLGLPSASASTRLRECPASHRMSQDAPDFPAGDAADYGTFIHSILEGNEDTSPQNSMDAWLVRSLSRQIVAMRQSAFGPYPWETMLREERISLHTPEGDTVFTGKPDRVEVCEYAGKRIAFVADFKTGWKHAQDASHNDQLRSLAVLVDRLPDGEFDEVYVGIAERVVDWESGISLGRYDREALDQAAEDLVADIEAANDPDAPAKAGDHCLYCPAKIQCGEFLSLAEMTTEDAKSLQHDMKNGTPIEGARLATFLTNAKLIAKAESEARTVALTMLKDNPESVPSFAVRKGRKIERVDAPASSFIDYVIAQRPDLDAERLRQEVTNTAKLAADDLRGLLVRAAGIAREEAESLVEGAPGYALTQSSDYIQASRSKKAVKV